MDFLSFAMRFLPEVFAVFAVLFAGYLLYTLRNKRTSKATGWGGSNPPKGSGPIRPV